MRVQFTVDKVPFYKHTEEFRLGQEVSMGRRDKKSGMQHAVLRAVPEGVQVDIKLDAPFSGAGFADIINPSTPMLRFLPRLW